MTIGDIVRHVKTGLEEFIYIRDIDDGKTELFRTQDNGNLALYTAHRDKIFDTGKKFTLYKWLVNDKTYLTAHTRNFVNTPLFITESAKFKINGEDHYRAISINTYGIIMLKADSLKKFIPHKNINY